MCRLCGGGLRAPDLVECGEAPVVCDGMGQGGFCMIAATLFGVMAVVVWKPAVRPLVSKFVVWMGDFCWTDNLWLSWGYGFSGTTETCWRIALCPAV